MRLDTFEDLYAAHAEPLFAFLAYRTGDRALAEDLLSETFERALKARRGFDRSRGSQKSWLYAIALNCLRDAWRKGAVADRSMTLLRAGQDGAEDGVEPVAGRLAVIDAVQSLAPEEQEAIAFRYGADMTVPEMAEMTGEKLTTMEGRVYRALRKLRALLDDDEHEGGIPGYIRPVLLKAEIPIGVVAVAAVVWLVEVPECFDRL